MLHPLFFEDDVSSNYESWLDIANEMGVEGDPCADDLWAFVRHSEHPPHLGNASMYFTLSAIAQWCEDRHYPCDYFINALDTHLYLDDQEIFDSSDFWTKISELDELKCAS